MEIIKRYESNRKLYSTHLSKYVTLNYVIDLVRTKQKFTVVDSKTEKDIKNLTLKQALLLVDLSTDNMAQLIRSE